MPSKNIVKNIQSNNFYHVYNRGVGKMDIFIDEYDYQKMLSIIARYLDPKNSDENNIGAPYIKFNEDIELLSYCLMPNHYHFLFYVNERTEVLSQFQRSVFTAYSMYFNAKYSRVGTLFQSRYKASNITTEAYLIYISAYIHLNPQNHLDYPYSSLRYYLGRRSPAWLKAERIIKMFEGNSFTDYGKYMKDLKTRPIHKVRPQDGPYGY